MQKTLIFPLLSAVILMTSACGGDGPGTTPPAPVPTPTPTPSPTPTPAPTQFPLNGSSAFPATTGFRAITQQSAASPADRFDQQGVSGRSATDLITYNAANGTYTLQGDGGTPGKVTFMAADRQTSGDHFEAYAKDSAETRDQLNVYANAREGSGTTAAPVALTYLSYAIWSHTDKQAKTTDTAYLLFGFPTSDAQMPRSGMASYRGVATASVVETNVQGSVGRTYDLDGTATVSADFGASSILTTLSLNGVAYDGTGAIAANQFDGIFTSASQNFHSGSFMGGFYGPEAREVGYAFSIAHHNPDPNAGAAPLPLDIRTLGVVVGTKD